MTPQPRKRGAKKVKAWAWRLRPDHFNYTNDPYANSWKGPSGEWFKVDVRYLKAGAPRRG